MSRLLPRFSPVLTALLCTFLLVSCETSFEPFADEGAYSIYGYLSSSRDRQFIRVKPLNEPLGSSERQPLDVTVTLENLTAGTSATLTDSIVIFEDQGTEVVTHNFWTDMPIEPASRYRVTVDGPAGTTRATTTTPDDANTVVRPDSAGCVDTFTISFLAADDFPQYGTVSFRYDGALQNVRVLEDRPPATTSPPEFRFQPESILRERIPFPEQSGFPCLYASRCLQLDDNKIDFSYLYTSSDWLDDPPELGQEFNPSLNQPDIENGVGFFGAIRRDNFTVKVDTSELILVGLDPNTCLDPFM